MAIYKLSDNRPSITVERADRLNTVTVEMGREFVEASAPLCVDEFAGRRPAAGGSAFAPGSSP
jgi:hypothetical protein